MPNEVEKFDPSTLMQGVKDRIKATFVSLIPEEQWEQMVQKEIENYFHHATEHYNNQSFITPFHLDVRKLISEECIKRTQAYLGGPEFQDTWVKDGQPVVGAKIEELIVKNSGEIMVTAFGTMFSSMLQNFKSSMQNQRF